MRRKNGFAFIESVIVLTVVTLSLVLLLTTYSLIARKTKEKENYDRASDKYLLYSIMNLGTNARYNYRTFLEEDLSIGPKITPENCHQNDIIKNIYNDNDDTSGESEYNCKKIYDSMDIKAIYIVKDIYAALRNESAASHFDNGVIEYMKTLKKCNTLAVDEDGENIYINNNYDDCDEPINYIIGVFYRNNQYYFASLQLGNEKLSENKENYTLTINYKYEDGGFVNYGGNIKNPYIETYKDVERYSIATTPLTGYTPDQNIVSGIMDGGNKTITVKYIANKYAITLNKQGGTSGTTTATATYDKKLPNITIPSKAGYTFNGYYDTQTTGGNLYYNSSGTSSVMWKLTNPMTLYARWSANNYTVSYNGNGATSGSMQNSSHTYDVSKKLNTNKYIKDNYIFKGWNTSADGSGTNYTDAQSVKNLTTTNNATITLYAQWEMEKILCSDLSTQLKCANLNTGLSDPAISYTGNCSYVCDSSSDENFRIKFLSSGSVTFKAPIDIDIFAVGGGGGGGNGCSPNGPGFYCQNGGAGGGGYTETYPNISFAAGTYSVVIGNGGRVNSAGSKSYFADSSKYFASGGGAGSTYSAGSGGSGGGSASCAICNGWDWTGCVNHSSTSGSGGRFGNSGSGCSTNIDNASGGRGQEKTTCEFGEGTRSGCNSGVTEYSRGGNSASYVANSGNGGNTGGGGSSGIVIIRNAR